MQFKSFFFALATFLFFSFSAFAQSDTCQVELSTKVLKISTVKTALTADNIVKIKTNCYLEYGRLQIFSRWGQIVFDEKNTNNGFDGFIKGKALGDGVYFYKITYQKIGEREKLETTGQLTVMQEY